MLIRSTRIQWVGIALASLLFMSPAVMAKTTEKSGGGFRYYDRVENPGTRSAGVRGVLLYKGKYLQPLTGAIKTPIGSFHYIESPILFEPQGWFPVQDIVIANATESLDPATLQKGTYKGPRLLGTPEDWCYLATSDTWLAPHLLATNDRLNPFRLQDSLPLDSPRPKKPASPPPACQEKVVRGPCKALFTVFYFDESSRRCKSAFWGGCEGVVPFKTLDDCQKACEPKP